tara:strand:- start:14142 stop:15077 length:936 start_codon:yes stop_codon:yes gene_type:complete
LKNITYFEKIKLRLLKSINLYGHSGIKKTSSTQLTRHASINAIQGNIELGKHVRIGNFTEITSAENTILRIKDHSTTYSHCIILGEVEIERYCTLASNIYISAGNHYATRYPELPLKIQDKIILSTPEGKANHCQKVHLHEDVWIGAGVFIAQGVTIGRGAIIGANSVVTKDVAPYSIVVGIPAQVLKQRLEFKPPSEISAKNQSDLPYFYQGFDHFKLPEEIQQSGMYLIDDAICKLTLTTGKFSIEGLCIAAVNISIAYGNSEKNYNLNPGKFEIKFEANSSAEMTIDLLLTSSSINNVSINSIKQVDS